MFGRLTWYDFGIAFARVAQHGSKHMTSAFLPGRIDPGTPLPKVDLQLCSGFNFNATKRKLFIVLAQSGYEAPNRPILATEPMLLDQILKDPLSV